MPEMENHGSESDICADDEDSPTSSDSDFVPVIMKNSSNQKSSSETKTRRELKLDGILSRVTNTTALVEKLLISVKEEDMSKNQLTLPIWQKGSNTSGEFSNRPVKEYLDFSDSEENKSAKKERIAKVQNWILPDETLKSQCLMSNSNSQQNLNCNHKPSFYKNNITVSTGSRTIPFSRVNSSHSSPSPSVSSVFEAALFTSNSYSSHSSSPPPSVSDALISLRFNSFSNPYPHPLSSTSAQKNSSFSVPTSSAALRHSSSTPKQPYVSPSQRSFPSQNAPQRVSLQSSYLQSPTLGTILPCQSESPFMLQSHQQSHLQRCITPQSAIKQSVVPLQTAIQGLTFPLQNEIQRPTLQLPQKLAFPPPLSPQQTHLFGQVTFMNCLLPLQSPVPPPPLPPPSISICRLVPPPVIPVNYISPVNPQTSPCHLSSFPFSQVPPHHPLTLEIPNLNSAPVSFSHPLTDPSGSNTTLPVRYNVL